MDGFAWKRVSGTIGDHAWDDVLITDNDEAFGLTTGDWIRVSVARLDEFIAWLAWIREQVQEASDGGEA